MKVSQPELLGSAAIVLYIALFSHSPPTALRSALGNVLVASVVFVGIAYITLWRSRTIGVLLILAFLLTMTRVTEHLTGSATSSSVGGGANTTSGPSSTPPTNTPGTPPPPAPSGPDRAALQERLKALDGDLKYLQGLGLNPETNDTLRSRLNEKTELEKQMSGMDTTVSADAKNSAAPAQTPHPDAKLNASVTLPTAPAIPPAPTFPSPVMSCNVESFTPF